MAINEEKYQQNCVMYSHQQGLAVFFLHGVVPDGLFFGFETKAYAFVKVIILSFDQ